MKKKFKAYSNTTLVKVKYDKEMIYRVEFVKIQIQHLLKLNLVGLFIFIRQNSIQIQHLLKLNIENPQQTVSQQQKFKYNTC